MASGAVLSIAANASLVGLSSVAVSFRCFLGRFFRSFLPIFASAVGKQIASAEQIVVFRSVSEVFRVF